MVILIDICYLQLSRHLQNLDLVLSHLKNLVTQLVTLVVTEPRRQKPLLPRQSIAELHERVHSFSPRIDKLW